MASERIHSVPFPRQCLMTQQGKTHITDAVKHSESLLIPFTLHVKVIHKRDFLFLVLPFSHNNWHITKTKTKKRNILFSKCSGPCPPGTMTGGELCKFILSLVFAQTSLSWIGLCRDLRNDAVPTKTAILMKIQTASSIVLENRGVEHHFEKKQA